jgi:hypothetical protein
MAYPALKKEAAPGEDGETWQHYGETLEASRRISRISPMG